MDSGWTFLLCSLNYLGADLTCVARESKLHGVSIKPLLPLICSVNRLMCQAAGLVLEGSRSKLLTVAPTSGLQALLKLAGMVVALVVQVQYWMYITTVPVTKGPAFDPEVGWSVAVLTCRFEVCEPGFEISLHPSSRSHFISVAVAVVFQSCFT